MATYVDLNGFKYVQLDDGILAPVNVSLSLEGGTLTKLPQTQIDALRTPSYPTQYPIPATQVADLKLVTVSNFPAAFSVANFPAAFNCGNMPATFPLPNNQETMLSAINAWTASLDKGSGQYSTTTLRAVLATNQPAVSVAPETTTMSAISFTGSGDQTILTPSTNAKSLRITDICFTAASLVSVQFKQGTTAQGQSSLSGAMSVVDHIGSYSRAIALAAGKSFVINTGSSVAVNGYICWWEV